jgi:hypothetical protein
MLDRGADAACRLVEADCPVISRCFRRMLRYTPRSFSGLKRVVEVRFQRKVRRLMLFTSLETDAASRGRLQLRGRRSAGNWILRAGGFAALLFALLSFCAVFVTHARWILTHFSHDGDLFDSGWFAYLFGSGDPLLHNPSAVDPKRLSFYTYHLAPHLYLFGVPLSLLGLSGIEIFAFHQGLFFGLFFISLYLITSTLRPGQRDWAVAALSSLIIGTLSHVLFQAAAYPHYEIVLLALSSLALAAWASNHYFVFAFCLLWLPLVREDGGFYAAFVCLACIALDYSPSRRRDVRIARVAALALLEITASVCALIVKARYFPSAWFNFSFHFSGNSWDHVSIGLIKERLHLLITDLNTLPVIAGSAILAAVDVRYASGFVLLCPLYALHLLSVRHGLGEFRLYYALPWLLPPVVWLAVFAKRSRAAATALPESIILLVLAIALSVPMRRAIGVEREYSYVIKLAFVRPVVSIPSIRQFALEMRQNYADGRLDGTSARSQCVSQGIAALMPNDVQADEVVYANSDLAKCRSVLLLRGTSEYGSLSARAEAHEFKPVATRHNAALWVREAN